LAEVTSPCGQASIDATRCQSRIGTKHHTHKNAPTPRHFSAAVLRFFEISAFLSILAGARRAQRGRYGHTDGRDTRPPGQGARKEGARGSCSTRRGRDRPPPMLRARVRPAGGGGGRVRILPLVHGDRRGTGRRIRDSPGDAGRNKRPVRKTGGASVATTSSTCSRPQGDRWLIGRSGNRGGCGATLRGAAVFPRHAAPITPRYPFTPGPNGRGKPPQVLYEKAGLSTEPPTPPGPSRLP
jgi:hypothetical protein